MENKPTPHESVDLYEKLRAVLEASDFSSGHKVPVIGTLLILAMARGLKEKKDIKQTIALLELKALRAWDQLKKDPPNETK